MGGQGGGFGAMGFGWGGDGAGGFAQGNTVAAGSLVAAVSPARDRVVAYSAETGTKKSYQAPSGVKLAPIAGPSVLALAFSGDKVTELAAYDPDSGRWSTQKLREPARGAVYPRVGPSLVAYRIGRFVYAYSTSASTENPWDVLDLKQAPQAEPPIVWTKFVTVRQGSRVHVFSAKTARWIELDTRTDEEAE
jgi:hypothetical protein